MVKTKVLCDKNFIVGEIDPRLFGSFAEHMGRVIYTGSWRRAERGQTEET